MDADAWGALAFGSLCCLLTVGIPLSLPVYALVMGYRRRKAIQQTLATREPRLAHLTQVSVEASDHPGPTTLVHGSVAYAADFPSRWATGWRNLAGGHATSLNEQIDLARRLATVRMLEEAATRGAVGVANVRFETSHIDMNSGSRGQQALVIDVLAYGTALLPAHHGGRREGPR